ncbi:hypothetical protein [Arhodomonas sp. SL1]|uniref:hypothetical protein n=1 Tax=Arhodomonas sp. SL1 TaxID=3425691 RepID=UPI003F881D45
MCKTRRTCKATAKPLVLVALALSCAPASAGDQDAHADTGRITGAQGDALVERVIRRFAGPEAGERAKAWTDAAGVVPLLEHMQRVSDGARAMIRRETDTQR